VKRLTLWRPGPIAAVVATFLILGAEALGQAYPVDFSVDAPIILVYKDMKQVNRPAQVGDTIEIGCNFSAYHLENVSFFLSQLLVRFEAQVDGTTIGYTKSHFTTGHGNYGWQWTANSAGAHTISCWVDSDKVYKEENYNDNKKQTTIMVAAAGPLLSLRNRPAVPMARAETKATFPVGQGSAENANRSPTGKVIVPSTDLVIDDIHVTLNPECNKSNFVLLVTIRVRNAGGLAVPQNSGALVRVTPDPPLIASGMPIPAISGTNTANVYVHLRTGGLPPVLTGKTYTLNVSLNDAKAVQESNYANNTGKTSFTFPASYCK
jgi:hypothetical protein